MRGSSVMHTESTHEGIVAHNSGIIALLPVCQRPAGVPEITYQSLLPPPTVPGLEASTQDFLTLRYLHRQYRRRSRRNHKGTNASRSLRNLACRRARQTDVTGPRNMNCVVGQQYRTANSKTAVCSRPLQPREPTVRVERLEVEVHRYGRIVPTSSGSYHILDTPTPESSSGGPLRPFSEDSKVVRAFCSVDDVNVPVNRVSRKSNRVVSDACRASGVCDGTSDSNITDSDCDCTVGVNAENISSKINEATTQSYSNDKRFKKSAHEYGRWETDLTIYSANSSSDIIDNVAGLHNVPTDRQYFHRDTKKSWKPLYEPISDPDSEPDHIKVTAPSKKQMDDLDCTKHVNRHCDRSRNFSGRSRRYNITDTGKGKSGAVSKRRHSAPDDYMRTGKEERKNKNHRRWSFNTESDMLQTDHKETAKKLYLNKLVFSKNTKIKTWDVLIDIARDEHTIEEYQFPEPPALQNMVVKEEREEVTTAMSERKSSDKKRSMRTSNKVTVAGDSPCSGFNHDLNTDNGDEDTIVASDVLISVPINQAFSLGNVLDKSPVSDRGAGTNVPRSAHKNSVANRTSCILTETAVRHEVQSEVSDTRSSEIGVLAKTWMEKRESDCSVSAEGIIADDSSNHCALKVIDSVKYCPRNSSLCGKCEKGTCVQHMSYNLPESQRTRECYNQKSQHQYTNVAPKNSNDSRETSANVETDVRRDNGQGLSLRVCSQEFLANDASKNVKYRTAHALLTKSEELTDTRSARATAARSVHVKHTDCNRSSEEWPRLLHKASCSISESLKDEHARNFESRHLTVSPKLSPQHVVGQENITGPSTSINNSRPYDEPIKDRDEKENENFSNDSDKEVVICDNTEGGITCQTGAEHSADKEMDSENIVGVSKRVRECREATNGNADTSPKKTKGRRRKGRFVSKRLEHISNEPSGDDSNINRKQRGPRKPRFSRRSFRHDSIQTFKVSTAFPPHFSWRYKCKKPEFPDPVDPKMVDSPSPIMNPSQSESLLNDGVTNTETEDDIPSPASLTIDLGEQNANATELSTFEEDDGNRENNIDGSFGEEDVISPVRRSTSTDADDAGMKEKIQLVTSPNNHQDQSQIGDVGSESSDEGQNKRKRKRAKKSKTGDASGAVDVTQHKLTAQMQEKGRRLAQELPGFNWLEEKIRNGGVTTVLPPKRVSGGSLSDPPNKSILASETTRNVPSHHVPNTAADATRSRVLATASSPPESRNSKRLQEYLLKPPKRARSSPTDVSEVGKETAPSLQPTRQHADASPSSVPPLHRLQYPQQRSPRHIQPQREGSPHHQSPRRPVIVSVSEIPKSSDVSPLLQQLTSGGELEVTLSTPSASSSASSDSGVVSLSSLRASSDGEQPEITHVNVKPANRQRHTEEKPGDAPQHPSASYKRVSYGVDQLSQPHQPEPSIFTPHEHIPLYVWNREPPRWQGVSDVAARKVQETASCPVDTAFSDRIATMARHAATSFDTGLGMGLTVSQDSCHRVARHQQHRPAESAHHHREHILRPSGYIAPHVQQPGAYDFRSSQYRLCQPSYMVPQPSVKPQIVRPSAQYPAGMGPCHPSHTCSQTFTAASNSQGFFPGIPQHSSNLMASHPSMFSPHSSRRKTDPSLSPTSSAAPTHSSSVQEIASEALQTPSSTQNEAQIPGPQSESRVSGPDNQAKNSSVQHQGRAFDHQNKAHVSAHENQPLIPDTVTKEKAPRKDIEEIRKAAEAAVEELEKIEQLKESTKKNLERLKLAEEQAMKELARTQKQLQEAVGVQKTGKAVEPRPGVPVTTDASSESSKPISKVVLPSVAQERHQPLAQNNQMAAQKPNNSADAKGSSKAESHITFPGVSQEINQSDAACENRQLGAGRKNNQSDITQNNLQSGGAYWKKESKFTHENHQQGTACRNQQPSDACQKQQSEVAHENRLSEAACKNLQPTPSDKNRQLGTTCESRQSETEHENNRSGDGCKSQQSAVEGENENSGVADDDHNSGVTHKNLPTQQKSSVTANSTVTSTRELSATNSVVVQANQQRESIQENHEPQQEQSFCSDSIGSSMTVLNKTVETVVWEKQPSRVANENSQKQHVPSFTSCSIDSSIPKLHMKIPMDTSENNLIQQKVSLNSTGNSLKQSSLTFSTAAHENNQSDVVCRNHEMQQQKQLDVTSDNAASSSSAFSRTPPAAVPGKKHVGIVCDNQQSENAFRNQKRHELSTAVDNRLAGSSGRGVNVTFLDLSQENQQSGLVCSSQQQRDACQQYHSAIPCESCQSVQRTVGSVDVGRGPVQGLHTTYPSMSHDKYHSEQKLNVSVSSMSRHSAPNLNTTCPVTGYKNRESGPRPMPPLPLLVQPPRSVPVSLAQQQAPIQTLPVSLHVSHSQSQLAPNLQTHSVVLRPHPVKGVHIPLQPSHSKFSSASRPPVHSQLPHMPRSPLYPQLSPVSQTALKSQLSVPQKSSHILPSQIPLESPHSQPVVISRTSPHFHSLSTPQRVPHYESSLSQLPPRSQSLVTTQKFPHSQALSLSHTSPSSHSLPVSQISPHSHSFPLSQTSPNIHSSLVSPVPPHSQILQISHTSTHSHFSPVSQASPQSQPLPFFQSSPQSQPGLALQPPVHHQTSQVPQNSPSKTQPLQVQTEQLRSTANLSHSSVEMLAMQSKTMPPPSQRQNVQPKPPEPLGSHIPISVLSRCTSPQAATDPITVHSVESPSDVSVITQFRSMQHSSDITQEPDVIITSTPKRLHRSTVEEYPIDLSIGKQKSAIEDKNNPSVSDISVVLCKEQNNPGQLSTSPRHQQSRSQIQPSVVHNQSPGEQNVMDNSGILCHNHKVPRSHTSQLQEAKNSGHQQQLQTSVQTGNKGRHPPLAALVSTADTSAGKDKDGLGRRHDSRQMPVPERSNGQKHFETRHDQNVDSGSALPTEHAHKMTHYPQHDVRYHTQGFISSSSYSPAYHRTVVRGDQSEQQQRNHTAEMHNESVVSSRRGTYCSAIKQVSPTTVTVPDRAPQDARSVAIEHEHSRSRLVCGRCNQTARFMCSACHNEWYCSAECQLRHWSYHSVDCSRQHQNEDK